MNRFFKILICPKCKHILFKPHLFHSFRFACLLGCNLHSGPVDPFDIWLSYGSLWGEVKKVHMTVVTRQPKSFFCVSQCTYKRGRYLIVWSWLPSWLFSPSPIVRAIVRAMGALTTHGSYYIIDLPLTMGNLILIEDTRFFRYEKSFDSSLASCGF